MRPRLAAALRVRQPEAAHKAQHLDIDFGCKPTDEGISLIAVLGQIARADNHIRVPAVLLRLAEEGVVNPPDNIGAVGKIGVGKHHKIALRRQQRRAYGAALALIIGVAYHADVRQTQLRNRPVAPVCTAVVGKNNLIIIEICRHIVGQCPCRVGNDAVFVIHGDTQGHFHDPFHSSYSSTVFVYTKKSKETDVSSLSAAASLPCPSRLVRQ